MKTKLLTVLSLLIYNLSFGQWIDPGESGTGPIHYNGGTVGIGTDSPNTDYQLNLIGESYLQGDVKINGAILFNQGVNAPVANSTHPAIYESSNSGLPYPFNEAGNLILQPESIYNKDIVFMTGKTDPEVSMIIDHSGRVAIGSIELNERFSVSNGNILVNNNTGTSSIENPSTIRLSSENNSSSWNTSDTWANVDFESNDVSGYGVGVRARIGSYMTNLVGGNTGLKFYTSSNGLGLTPKMTIDHQGNVGIGTITPTSLLSVAGTMDAREIKVEVGAGEAPDYVFADDYKLSTLEETASYINENHHLPEIPSAKEMEANGVNLGEMNMLLLKKIEELTLHLIEIKAKNKELENRMIKLENQ